MTVQPGAFPGMIWQNVGRLEAEVLADLHNFVLTGASLRAGWRGVRLSIRVNREELVVAAVTGEVAPMLINSGLYDVSFEGQPFIVPSVGGITPNVRIGSSAFAFMADHVEPGVSVKHPDTKANISLNVLACIGNEAIVSSGDAKGERGRVTGKHGGVEHVMVDFAPEVMRRMTIGDKITIWSCGLGMRFVDLPGVKVFNMDPDLLHRMGVEIRGGRLFVHVARIVPASVMGSGLGRTTVVRGDYDIQTFDDEMADRYGLRELRLGDIVAISDADNSYGRIYRSGAISIGVVVHGRSFMAGHGPGVTTLLTSAKGEIDVEIDERANLATYFKVH